MISARKEMDWFQLDLAQQQQIIQKLDWNFKSFADAAKFDDEDGFPRPCQTQNYKNPFQLAIYGSTYEYEYVHAEGRYVGTILASKS